MSKALWNVDQLHQQNNKRLERTWQLLQPLLVFKAGLSPTRHKHHMECYVVDVAEQHNSSKSLSMLNAARSVGISWCFATHTTQVCKPSRYSTP
jgi:hypothetical protein